MKNILALFQRTVLKRNSRLQVEKGSPAGERTVLEGNLKRPGQTLKVLAALLFLPAIALATVGFHPTPVRATSVLEELSENTPLNNFKYGYGAINPDCDMGEVGDTTVKYGRGWGPTYLGAVPSLWIVGVSDKDGKQCTQTAMLPQTGKIVTALFQQPSGQEYMADILDNIGIPQLAKPAYAQGTGYSAMSPFLPFWKAFRNLAYSLYIIMFVVVGIMIMLRTKVNAQTIITIQTALPNLLITLILITFSYAIVGFMIDLMYFLIYFIVFLLSSPGIDIISTPTKTIARLLSGSAWTVMFAGRNSVIFSVAAAIDSLLLGVGTGVLSVLGKGAAIFSPTYLIAAVWLGITMIKLMFTLVKAYIMLIIQTVTAPVQLLMNAMPGSKAFSEWLKKTASYLIPFPIVGAMFIMAAVFVGDPSKTTLWNASIFGGDTNPFGINGNSDFYSSTGSGGDIWMPPFTLSGTNLQGNDIMALIGFFIFTMTPAAAKMAMDWLQVKESPYASEAMAGFGGFAKTAMSYPGGMVSQARSMHEQKKVQEYGATRYAQEAEKLRAAQQAKQTTNTIV